MWDAILILLIVGSPWFLYMAVRIISFAYFRSKLHYQRKLINQLEEEHESEKQ